MSDVIPIFPLSVVLLPRMPLPLHIFEERYKHMLADCERLEKPFGIVPVLSDEMHEAGCIAELERVIERYDDGRSDILTFGAKRFVVHRVIEEREYLEAEIEYFDDEAPEDDLETMRLADEARALLLQFAEIQGQSVDEQALERVGIEDLSFLLTGTEVFNHRDKYRFLQMRSSKERLRRAVPALERGIKTRRSKRNLKRILGEFDGLENLFN